MAEEKRKAITAKDKEKLANIDVSTPEGKAEALQNAVKLIEKQFGKGSIMKLGDSNKNKNIEVVSTGCLSLDVALGIGGLPKGRIIEIYGPESSGKTTIALHAVAEVQKAGGVASFVDAEHALDPVYAKNLGVNIDDLYISQPDDGEQALDIVETMVRSHAIDIIVVDSVAALVPKAEIDGVMGESHMGLQARLMSQALRKLTSIVSKSNCIVIFINQLREKIGVMFGNPETTTGGRALKFYASVRIEIRKGEAIKEGGEFIGNLTKAKIVKNKVAPPFKTSQFDIIFGEGISRAGDVLDLAAELNIVNKSGSWYSYNEQRMGQGRENSKKFLVENPEIWHEIENAVRVHYEMPTLEEMAKNATTVLQKAKNGELEDDEEVEDNSQDVEIEESFEEGADFEYSDEMYDEDAIDAVDRLETIE